MITLEDLREQKKSLAVVGLGMLAWLLSRRRAAPAAPKPRRSLDNEALAASMGRGPGAAATESEPEPVLAEADAEEVVPTASSNEDVERVIDLSDLPTTPAAHIEAPTWHSGSWMKTDTPPEVAAPAASSPRFVPPVDEALPASKASPESMPDAFDEPLPEPASAEQRMKLARAFLDIGDDHSARQLLLELLDGPDPAMRTDAAKLLRELG